MAALKGMDQNVRDAMSLRQRLEALEAEIQECRQMNLRLAELTDLVQELLLPIAVQDKARIAELAEKYQRGL